jgi:hypothetical protein
MANRILRDWTQSENINTLDFKSEVFFTRLIMKADDFGCFYGNFKLIKSALYPLRDILDIDLKDCILQCEKNQLIYLYVVDNKDYIRINNFGQRLRIMKSKFPQPLVSNPQSDDRNLPLETKRNEVETETEVETKRNEKETLETFFDEDYQLEYVLDEGVKIYGAPYQIKTGGMSEIAIKQHCRTYNLKYPKSNG